VLGFRPRTTFFPCRVEETPEDCLTTVRKHGAGIIMAGSFVLEMVDCGAASLLLLTDAATTATVRLHPPFCHAGGPSEDRGQGLPSLFVVEEGSELLLTCSGEWNVFV
jgi:hypothetical protein